MIPNPVKLVIWDLDDTFWRGTLTEGGIQAIPENCKIVRALSRRGIVNSICSKNDYEQAKAALKEIGIWKHFVFPTLSFSPKGKAVAEMIENAGLRAENVLFIDDNVTNLEEVKYFSPGIMTARPEAVLGELLSHEHCAGKPDLELTRLNQYRLLQRKVEDRHCTLLSNEEFLRASGISVTIDYDVENNLDRVVELINRSNQLNYTKVRLNTPEEIEKLQILATQTFSYHAGCVRASDKYGEYGIVGFYLLKLNAFEKKLVHFVFSCRAMNMGIEQYVYELLGKPDLRIIPPVSYGLNVHERIDWISTAARTEESSSATNRRLVLLGGCDLLQLASYCSIDRLEFVNGCKEDTKIRYDDPSFILADRDMLRDCETARKIPCWTYEDAVSFDEGIASAELILLSLWPGMQGEYFQARDGLTIRLPHRMLGQIRARDLTWFNSTFSSLALDDSARISRMIEAFDVIGARCPQGCRTFLLSTSTQAITGRHRDRRLAYNLACREYCSANSPRFHYVDVDEIVPADHLVDRIHFSRAGYLAIAQDIVSAAQNCSGWQFGGTGS